jgi:glycosyltransferase involved in cell wall biosynthesis
MTPVVSFVVPCYKLAHLLPECIESILGQTYGDFEVLVMDDCSPDNTPEIAKSFQDPRVKYIRNEPNLGHLRNYNKGISLTRGKYVWLISADDYLRRSYVLWRYVELLDKNPHVGYTFCPGVSVRNGQETGIVEWAIHWSDDRTIAGQVLLEDLLWGNKIVAASGMARRECYEKISFFPLDMPWSGDWYLWCVFALYFDVGYFAEPMVCYRAHDLSMGYKLLRERERCATEDLTTTWTLKRNADIAGHRRILDKLLTAVACRYVETIASGLDENATSCTAIEQFEQSLARNSSSERERNRVRARVYAGIADRFYWGGELSLAKQFYLATLRKDLWMPKELAKWLLLSCGKGGDYLRRSLKSSVSKHSKELEAVKLRHEVLVSIYK